ncbi:MAG: hypothetical protein K6348_05830, partial [Deferribacterales bacterium]
ANKENDLPNYILDKILNIQSLDESLLDELIEKIEYFNPEAGLGCFSEGYSVKDIENLLKKIVGENF